MWLRRAGLISISSHLPGPAAGKNLASRLLLAAVFVSGKWCHVWFVWFWFLGFVNSRLTELCPFPYYPNNLSCLSLVSIRFCSSARHCQVALYIWKWKRLICGICIYGCTLPVDFLSGRAVSVEFSYLEVPYLWYFYIWKHLVSGICNETCVRGNYCDVLFWQIHESLESDRHGKRQKKNTKRKRSPSPQPEKVKRKR